MNLSVADADLGRGGSQYLPASIVGKTTRNLDASQTLWAFVSRFTLVG